MKKIGIWLLKIVGGLFLVAVALAVVAVLINVKDEDLIPDAAAFLKFERAKFPDAAQNGWFHAIGLAAKDPIHPHAAGMSWAEAAEKAQAERLKGRKAAWPEAVGQLPKVKNALCTNLHGDSCLATVREKTAEARKLVAEHKALIDRYRGLHAYAAYRDAVNPALYDYPFPAYSPMWTTQRLWQVEAALRLQDGEFDAVLGDLEKDLALSRRMLAGSDLLLGKMVAASQLARSAIFASEVLRTYREQVGARAANLQKLLQPLNAEERDLTMTIRTETRFLDTGIRDAMSLGTFGEYLGSDTLLDRWFGRMLFQPNATLNTVYRLWVKPSMELVAAPAAQIDLLREKMAAMKPESSGWTLVYNPVGKLVVIPNLSPSYYEYVARIHDYDGLLRLVSLQAGMVAAGVGDDGVPAYLAGADKAYTDPYTGKTMEWDAKTRQIHFRPRSTNLKQHNKIGGVAGRLGVTL